MICKYDLQNDLQPILINFDQFLFGSQAIFVSDGSWNSTDFGWIFRPRSLSRRARPSRLRSTWDFRLRRMYRRSVWSGGLWHLFRWKKERPPMATILCWGEIHQVIISPSGLGGDSQVLSGLPQGKWTRRGWRRPGEGFMMHMHIISEKNHVQLKVAQTAWFWLPASWIPGSFLFYAGVACFVILVIAGRPMSLWISWDSEVILFVSYIGSNIIQYVHVRATGTGIFYMHLFGDQFEVLFASQPQETRSLDVRSSASVRLVIRDSNGWELLVRSDYVWLSCVKMSKGWLDVIGR